MSILDKAVISAGTVLERLANGTYTTSLVDITRPCRVSPKTVVDDSLKFNEHLPVLLQATNSIFSAFYLLAFNAVASVDGVKTMRTLDQLNPNRDPMHSASPVFYATEDIEGEATPVGCIMPGVEDDNSKMIYEDTSLTVGKLLNVTVRPGASGINIANVVKDNDDVENQGSKDSKPTTIPVLVVVTPAFMDAPSISHIMEEGSPTRTTKHRWYMMRSGQISFWADFLGQRDLAQKYRHTLANDKNNVYLDIKERRHKNRMAAVVSNRLSLAEAANIWIITKETERKVNRDISGRISDYATRERIFGETFMMMIMIVDTQFEEITIYYQGIKEATETRIRDLKRSEKGNGADIGELMEAFLKSNVPSI